MNALDLKRVDNDCKIFCPVCFFPFEYCKYGNKSVSKCKTWLKDHDLALYQSIYVEETAPEQQLPQQLEASSISETPLAAAAAAPAKKQQSQKGEKPKKKIEVVQAMRKGNKTVTIISNLSFYGIDLKKTAKKFANKFACGSSVSEDVTNPAMQVVVIQGEFAQAAIELLVKEHGDVLSASSFTHKTK